MPKRQPGLQNSPAVLAWVAAKTRKTIPVLLATNFPVLKSTRHIVIFGVAVKAKPECCSEQNRNREKRLVDRGSVHDFALKKTIIEG